MKNELWKNEGKNKRKRYIWNKKVGLWGFSILCKFVLFFGWNLGF